MLLASNTNDLLRKISSEYADTHSCFEDAAHAIMSTPRAGLFDESWIDECADLMKTGFKDQIEYIRELGELGMTGAFDGMSAKSKEELNLKYTHPIKAKKRRGRLAGILARLWRVYKDRRYLTGCKENMFSLIRAMPNLPDDDPGRGCACPNGHQPGSRCCE